MLIYFGSGVTVCSSARGYFPGVFKAADWSPAIIHTPGLFISKPRAALLLTKETEGLFTVVSEECMALNRKVYLVSVSQ